MATATAMAMATTTTINQQSTKCGSKRNGGDGDRETAKVTAGNVGGGGGDMAIVATATTMVVMVAGSFRRYNLLR
jgi:hypothetical protein